MSYLSLTRQPKRMLVFFEEDKTSCMLPNGDVNKRILGSNQTLSEGAKVEVDYEKERYEAQILKLHGKFNIRTINSVITLLSLYSLKHCP